MSCKLTLLVFLFFSFSTTFGQDHAVPGDSVLLKMNITTFDGKKINTEVRLEALSTNKVKKLKTAASGSTNIMLPTDENYSISIAASGDSYEFEIPDFSISPLELTFKFNLREKITSRTGLRLLNAKDVKDVTIQTDGAAAISCRVENDTAYFDAIEGKKYSITVKGVTIKNNSFTITPGETGISYLLHFTGPAQAELVPVKTTDAVIHIFYENLSGEKMANETVLITGTLKKEPYIFKTATNGSLLAVLPGRDAYTISLKHVKDVMTLNAAENGNTVVTNTIRLKYPGAKEWELAQKEQEEQLRRRDSLYKASVKDMEEEVRELASRIAAMRDKAVKSMAEDPDYFKKYEHEVAEIFKRNKDTWKSKMIVTDVTGSMSPYAQQLGMWHMLELMNKERSDYVFFNDGDNKSDGAKIIGKTGGIYVNLKASADSVIHTMRLAMRNGSGGDAPENNIEAILESLKYKPKDASLILIADHLSPVKDIELLKEVNVPVRVILCGAWDGYTHPDYLEIAYRTGGSIHTIEEDILDLSKLHNEGKITVAGTTYQLINGKFFVAGRKG